MQFSFKIGAPAFVLSVMGTDNKFEAVDVRNRWNYIKKEFQELGIEVINFSSDGDSRYVNAMKCLLGYGKISYQYNTICPIKLTGTEVTIQDTAHTVNNLKNRLFNTAVDLRMGLCPVTANHLSLLIDKRPKNEHLLSRSDLDNKDRMDYSVVLKISTENIEGLLKDYVDQSQGTVEYLKIMRYLLEALTFPNVSVKERLHKSFYSLFFLRLWKLSIIQSTEARMPNFVTNESFVNVEINAWVLLKFIILCRDRYGASMFKIYLMNSQVCERFFSLLR